MDSTLAQHFTEVDDACEQLENLVDVVEEARLGAQKYLNAKATGKPHAEVAEEALEAIDVALSDLADVFAYVSKARASLHNLAAHTRATMADPPDLSKRPVVQPPQPKRPPQVPEETQARIREIVRRVVAEHNGSQAAAGAVLGIHQTTVSDVNRGCSMALKTALRIVRGAGEDPGAYGLTP